MTVVCLMLIYTETQLLIGMESDYSDIIGIINDWLWNLSSSIACHTHCTSL